LQRRIGHRLLLPGCRRHVASRAAIETQANYAKPCPNHASRAARRRFAISKKGLGSALFRDAIKRTIAVHTEAGVSALAVHAIDDEAKAFYIQYGMQEFPANSRTLLIPLAILIKNLFIKAIPAH
jgi:hypothetical protein